MNNYHITLEFDALCRFPNDVTGCDFKFTSNSFISNLPNVKCVIAYCMLINPKASIICMNFLDAINLTRNPKESYGIWSVFGTGTFNHDAMIILIWVQKQSCRA